MFNKNIYKKKKEKKNILLCICIYNSHSFPQRGNLWFWRRNSSSIQALNICNIIKGKNTYSEIFIFPWLNEQAVLGGEKGPQNILKVAGSARY